MNFVHNNAIITHKDKKIEGVLNVPEIRPITDLRNTGEISAICHEKNEPIFITKNGYGDLVVMSIRTYENLLEEVHIDSAILSAETEINEGAKLVNAKESLTKLRRKYFG